MSVLITVILVTYFVLNGVGFIIICQDGPRELGDPRDQTLVNIMAFLVLFPAFFLYWIVVIKLAGFWNFLNSKPFKVTKFDIGEKVLYRGEEHTVLENEKTNKGERILITSSRFYGGMVVETKEVRKVSKLEQALK